MFKKPDYDERSDLVADTNRTKPDFLRRKEEKTDGWLNNRHGKLFTKGRQKIQERKSFFSENRKPARQSNVKNIDGKFFELSVIPRMSFVIIVSRYFFVIDSFGKCIIPMMLSLCAPHFTSMGTARGQGIIRVIVLVAVFWHSHFLTHF